MTAGLNTIPVNEINNQEQADGDSKEEYKSHDCYIDGIKCRADEARFGGIVIEVVQAT